MFSIVGLAGSLRAASFNRALLRAAVELAPDGVAVTPFDRLADIPPYNADVDAQSRPEAVTELSDAIRAADALLIVTPEYNYSMPGMLKNAIDWVSRPPQSTPLIGNPIAIIGASQGAFGTVRAQLALRQSLAFTGSVMTTPELMMSNAHTKFDSSLRLTDEPSRAQLAKMLKALEVWARRFS